MGTQKRDLPSHSITIYDIQQQWLERLNSLFREGNLQEVAQDSFEPLSFHLGLHHYKGELGYEHLSHGNMFSLLCKLFC